MDVIVCNRRNRTLKSMTPFTLRIETRIREQCEQPLRRMKLLYCCLLFRHVAGVDGALRAHCEMSTPPIRSFKEYDTPLVTVAAN